MVDPARARAGSTIMRGPGAVVVSSELARDRADRVRSGAKDARVARSRCSFRTDDDRSRPGARAGSTITTLQPGLLLGSQSLQSATACIIYKIGPLYLIGV